MICFCSAQEEDIDLLESLNVRAGLIPVLTCSKSLNTEFIRRAALRGVERFLVCDMGAEKISELVRDAIRGKGLKAYLKSCWPDSDDSSRFIQKFIDEIVHVFPHRMKIKEFAQRLRVSRGWLYKICKKVFHKTPTALLRRMWVHQALRMMHHTNLSNTEIAVQLDYSDESNMARDFRKELGYCPREARKRLRKYTPEELLSLST